MLLSALLPELPRDHPYFADRPVDCPGSIDVVSLVQIQHCLEQAWASGMDPKGRQHYRGRIADTSAWIGAVEVQTVLAACRLDATVVQFVRVPESRSRLGPFCGAYFDAPACAGSEAPRTSRALAAELLRRSSVGTAAGCSSSSSGSRNPPQPQSTSSSACRRCRHGPAIPLYLQYEGHSVTVVGVEYACSGTDDSNLPVVENLLVFDPRHSGSRLLSSLRRRDLASLRRSVSLLHAKDTQIVLCTTSGAFAANGGKEDLMSVVTASEEAVVLHRRLAVKR
jgi:hypothetical protein